VVEAGLTTATVVNEKLYAADMTTLQLQKSYPNQFTFRGSWVYLSAQRQATITELYSGFPQPPLAKASLVPQIRPLSFPFQSHVLECAVK
jgi:hypothetical protein